jgi:hypothetical protein
MPNKNHKTTLKQRIAILEKEIPNLSGDQRAKARLEYQSLLQNYRKECGLEDPIYLTRA